MGQVIFTVIVPNVIFGSEQLNIIIFVNILWATLCLIERCADSVEFRARRIWSFNGALEEELDPGRGDDA